MSQWHNQPSFAPNQPPNAPPQITPPTPPREHWRFRWGIVLSILTAVVTFWLISGMKPVFSFKDVMDSIGVVYENRFARLAAMGVLLIAITAIVRVARGRNKDS